MDLFENLKREVEKVQSPRRYQHSLAVSALAARLAARHGWDPELARRAGLLHDWAKEWPPRLLKEYVVENELKVPAAAFIAKASPNLFHAYVSADVVKRKGWLKDKLALRAIASHTLGSSTMSLPEKILYVSDFASPDRPYAEAALIRRMAMKDIHGAFVEALRRKMHYQLLKQKALHPLVFEVWNKIVCKL